MRNSFVIAVFALTLLAGCDEPTNATLASSVAGAWELEQPVTGGYFEMTLVSDHNQVSGSGSFVAEVAPGGSLTVTGALSGSVVNLDFVLHGEGTEGSTTTNTAHFTGALVNGKLKGTMQYGVGSADNPPFATLFRRIAK
jgi:hypothetical protein